MEATAPAQAAPVPGKRRTRTLVVAGIVALVVAALYTLSVISFTQEAERSATGLVVGSDDPNRLEMTAKVVSVDPVKGDMLVRLDYKPLGTLASADGLSPSKGLKLFVNSANGKQEQAFDKGKPMNPLDVTLNMDGQASSYPFDSHLAQLELYVTAPPADKSGGEEEEVPVGLTFFGSLHGLSIEAAQSPESANGYELLDITVSRSASTMVFAIFGMVVMWLIAAAVLFVVLSVIFGGRKPELAMLSLGAALLFGFYAFRNSMPGTPPIGTLSDVLAFFWAEAVAALALIALTTVWLLRPAK